MNIVYKFVSKVTGKYYIGSKQECEVIEGNIVDKHGKYYYSSSKSEAFWEELRDGNMDLTVLADNVPREDLLDVEAHWQQVYGGVNHDKTFNKCLANQLNTCMSIELQHRKNFFGQTTNEISNHNATVSKKDKNAVKEGFDNYGDKVYKSLRLKLDNNWSFKDLDRHHNRGSHYDRFLRGMCITDFDDAPICLIMLKEMMRQGMTFLLACETLSKKDYVVRYQLGDTFDNLLGKEHLVAEANGFGTRVEFDKQILRDFLNGDGHTKITTRYKHISKSTVARIINEQVRQRLNSNDIK